jgi:hypothetical protein
LAFRERRAIRPDGEIVGWLWDAPLGNGFPVTSNSFMLAALTSGAATYPELGELLPARSEDAQACRFCEGRQHLRAWRNMPCPVCGGRGWSISAAEINAWAERIADAAKALEAATDLTEQQLAQFRNIDRGI